MQPGIYIHIPFCISKCHYCNFYSVTSREYVPDFLESLFKEMAMYRDQFETFDTLYIGGGTPSVLPAEHLEELIQRIGNTFDLLPDSEITLEANPGDLDATYLTALRKTGINRLNIGVQSFDDAVLSLLGRRHTGTEALAAMEASRTAGFDNIGIDLIYCVPGQDMHGWMKTLDQALNFNPEHLSCYQLTLEPETPLGMIYRKGTAGLPDEEREYDFFIKTSEKLEDAGYIHYEVSNFARNGTFASRHNQKYWDHTPYLGLGPSAHSFKKNKRWWNHSSLPAYIHDIEQGKTPVEEAEVLTDDQLRLEALSLGLRTKKGINCIDFNMKYHVDLLTEKKEIIAKLKDGGLVDIQNGSLSPTRYGLAVADSLSLI
ncbi:MAG: radical SAM family heme chaperone HemW [Deltaproteobacteria bacterium]|nr:radical SAM family heme chaperone HemW [Deltaproteobacteria bacterium]